MRYSISNTAEYGDYTRGPRVIDDATRERMKQILGEIQSGDFAREWIAENRAGQENFKRMREEQATRRSRRPARSCARTWTGSSGLLTRGHELRALGQLPVREAQAASPEAEARAALAAECQKTVAEWEYPRTATDRRYGLMAIRSASSNGMSRRSTHGTRTPSRGARTPRWSRRTRRCTAARRIWAFSVRSGRVPGRASEKSLLLAEDPSSLPGRVHRQHTGVMRRRRAMRGNGTKRDFRGGRVRGSRRPVASETLASRRAARGARPDAGDLEQGSRRAP